MRRPDDYLVLDGKENDPRRTGDPLGSVVCYLTQGIASVVEWFGHDYWTRRPVLLATFGMDHGEIVVASEKNDIFRCIGCGNLIQSDHTCTRPGRAPTCKGCVHTEEHACIRLAHTPPSSCGICELDSTTVQPNLPGWVLIQDRKTGGGGHRYNYYAPVGSLTLDQLHEFLSRHPATDASQVKREGNALVVWSANLGPWIGKGGQWAKAYQKLGVRVIFREMKEITADQLFHLGPVGLDLKVLIEGEAIWTGKVMRDRSASHNSDWVWGLNPNGPAWKAFLVAMAVWAKKSER